MLTLEECKDLAQILGFAGVLFGVFKGIEEIRQNRRQRAEELRWKRANSAKSLLDDIHNHDLAKSAVRMLDWCDGQAEYVLPGGEKEIIKYSEVVAALGMSDSVSMRSRDIYIRDCFDWFFYRVDRIEHYIRRGLIDIDDVKAAFKVYAREVIKNQDVYDRFLAFHAYDLARDFFARYAAADYARSLPQGGGTISTPGLAVGTKIDR